MQSSNRWRRWTALAAALLVLNVSVTFGGIWPTPAIRWQGKLSIELAVCILMLAVASRWLGRPSHRDVAFDLPEETPFPEALHEVLAIRSMQV